MGLLPPVVATLLLDSKQYSAEMDKAILKTDELGAASKRNSGLMAGAMGKASTAVLGLGVAIGGYALDKAVKFQEGLDKLQNQAGITAGAAKQLGNAILGISSATGVAIPDLLQAGLAAEQAGVRGAKAQGLLSAASKASVITGQSVVDITKTLIAAQTLHIAKIMNINELTGLLIAGSKATVGGFGQEAAMLQGRVGVALAAVGLKMKDIIAAGAEFSKVGLNSRAVTAFATGVAKLNLPLDTVHITAKKTYTTLSTYALALQAVGLNQQKLASDLRTGGIPALLNEIKDAAAGSTPRLQELLHVVFGTGAATSNVLVNNLKQFSQVTKSLTGAGAGTLTSGFASAMKQLGPQMHVLEARFNVMFTKIGEHLLPTLAKAETWAIQLTDYLSAHPIIGKDMANGFGLAISGALGAKLGTVGVKIAAAFGLEMTAVTGSIAGAAIGVGLYAWIKSGGLTGLVGDFSTITNPKAGPAKKIGAGFNLVGQGLHLLSDLTNMTKASLDILKGTGNAATFKGAQHSKNADLLRRVTVTVKGKLKR